MGKSFRKSWERLYKRLGRKSAGSSLEKDMDSVWEQVEDSTLLTEEESDDIFRQIQHVKRTRELVSLRSRSSGSVFSAVLKVAASLLLVGSVTYFFTMYESDDLNPVRESIVAVIEKVAPEDQRKHFFLEDGTEVWLNTGSKLTYPAQFMTSERRVVLEGEGFFEVSEDKTRPFIVETNELNVRVLGTSFNVEARQQNNRTSVSVVSGIVEVTPSDESLREERAGDKDIVLPESKRLTKNDHVDFYHEDRKMVLSELSNLSFVKSWFTYEVRFDNNSMSEVARVLEKIYNVKITFDNEALRNCSLTMLLENNSLKKTLEIIGKANEINYVIENNEVILTGTGCRDQRQ